jgi:putative thioredoxin
MDLTLKARAPQQAAADVIKDTKTASFEADVILASRERPIIVDFWAPWCGPCKQLTPILEKVVRAAGGKVRMVKINIDENPDIAQALRIQSIPMVYAFVQGRPVDGFAGALPESQVKQFIDRVLKMMGPAANQDSPIELALDEAKQALEAGDHATARSIYAEILEVEPGNAAAYSGLARALLAAGDHKAVRQMLNEAPAELAKDKGLAAVRSSLELLEQSQAAGPLGELKRKVEADPADSQARYDLAMAQFAAGNREAAVDELLHVVKHDRMWNEEQARKQLVKFFEAFGPTDPLTVSTRRRLSSLLFR